MDQLYLKQGMMKLRLQICRFLKSHYGTDYNPDDEILITVGVSEALDLTMRSILNPGDEVLIPEPCYVSYGSVTALAGGKPIYISTAKTNFKLTPKDIERHCNKKTKAIIFNYPSNPTGASYTRKELEEIKKAVLRRNLIMISDEVYDELTYDFKHTPFVSLSGARKNTVYLNGFSKSYAMTGWRVGYACGPKEIIAAMTKIHQYTIMCVSITSQIAACEALVSGRKSVEEMKREYCRRREFVVEELNRLGLSCRKGQGGVLRLCLNKVTGLSSMDFCQRLLKEQKTAVVPELPLGRRAKAISGFLMPPA